MTNMLEVLWQDNRLIAINKPAGLATIPGRAESDSVLDQLGKSFRIVHRLDKETSGVLLLAKDRDAQRHLCNQFLRRTVQKEYLALVAALPSEDRGHINAPLGRHPKTAKVMAVTKHGRPALTDWQVVRRFSDVTLLQCFPQTGRTHQIRVHLKSVGMPLAIDALYGQEDGIYLSRYKRDYRHKPQGERPLIDRLTLHAEKISFLNLDDQPITVTCPLPRDFRATINMLTKYAAARATARPAPESNSD